MAGTSLADSGFPNLGNAAGVTGLTGTGFGVLGLSKNDAYEEPPAGPGMGVLGLSGTGPGVVGVTRTAAGVVGATVNAIGEDPPAGPGAGVLGRSGSGPGLWGGSLTQIGVHGVTNGEAEPAWGVGGFSLKPGVDPIPSESYVPENFGSRPGVQGTSGSGPGVRGESVQGPGVQAVSASGPALDVQGPARFSTAGAGVVAARQNEAAVANPAVTAQSHVSVTLTQDAVGAAVSWVQRQPGVGFVLHLTRRVRDETGFTYLIVEPGT